MKPFYRLLTTTALICQSILIVALLLQLRHQPCLQGAGNLPQERKGDRNNIHRLQIPCYGLPVPECTIRSALLYNDGTQFNRY